MNPKSLFSLNDHLEVLSQSADPLETLVAVVDFESFRALLAERLGYGDRPQGGRPPFDAVLMFKILILQTYHNLSDAKTEFYVRDRITWMRFLGFNLGDTTPDENTIRHFRNRLIETETLPVLMKTFEQQLEGKGYLPMGGQIVDASLVPAPKQRNTTGENAAIKEGKSAREIWPDQANKAAQKDVDARWTVEIGGKIRRRPDGSLPRQISQPKYGYKAHHSIDVMFGFIRKSEVTSATVYDGKLLERIVDFNNTASGVWGDRAYPSAKNKKWLVENGFRSSSEEAQGQAAARGECTREFEEVISPCTG